MSHHPTWRKSTFSGNTQGCVELAAAGGDVLMRDSKHPDDGHLSFTPAELSSLVAKVKTGVIDHLA